MFMLLIVGEIAIYFVVKKLKLDFFNLILEYLIIMLVKKQEVLEFVAVLGQKFIIPQLRVMAHQTDQQMRFI